MPRFSLNGIPLFRNIVPARQCFAPRFPGGTGFGLIAGNVVEDAPGIEDFVGVAALRPLPGVGQAGIGINAEDAENRVALHHQGLFICRRRHAGKLFVELGKNFALVVLGDVLACRDVLLALKAIDMGPDRGWIGAAGAGGVEACLR